MIKQGKGGVGGGKGCMDQIRAILLQSLFLKSIYPRILELSMIHLKDETNLKYFLGISLTPTKSKGSPW